MSTPRRLHLENLETRDVPAAFGTPWAYGDLINVSFAPENSKVDGVNSVLKTKLNAMGLTDSVWQGEILRTFQTWASVAKMNFGVVSDNGAKIGNIGAFQFDANFGDIRIFGVPLSSNVLAITTPPDTMAGTRAGDIILNTNKTFTVGTGGNYDLYTVMLQEIGHAIGMANSTDPLSPMFETYNGAKTGLTAGDISAVQALYGIRMYNASELFGNGSTTSATNITNASLLANKTIVTTIGEMATASDDDYYKFTVPTGVSSLTVQLRTAGYSLLHGTFRVLNSSGTVLGSATATGAGKDATISLSNLVAGQTYYVHVAEATGTKFALGLYRLRLVPPSATGEDVLFAGGGKDTDTARNETLATATTLFAFPTSSSNRVYSSVAQLSANDTDYYKVKSSSGGFNETTLLTASLRMFDNIATPALKVYNAQGALLTAVVKSNGTGFYAIEVDGATPDTDYFIAVTNKTGLILPADYKLDITFRTHPAAMNAIMSGSFASNVTSTATLTVSRSIQMAFDFTAVLPTAGTAKMAIFNASGVQVFSLIVTSGDIVSGIVLLNAGTYTVKYSTSLTTSSANSMVAIRGAVLTDPIGVTATDSSNPDYIYSTTTTSKWNSVTYPSSSATA